MPAINFTTPSIQTLKKTLKDISKDGRVDYGRNDEDDLLLSATADAFEDLTDPAQVTDLQGRIGRVLAKLTHVDFDPFNGEVTPTPPRRVESRIDRFAAARIRAMEAGAQIDIDFP